MELLKVAVNSVVSLAALFVLTKLMGNKQVSQLSMFDYIIGISIGSIAAEFATELDNPEYCLLAMVIYAVIAYLVSVVTSKSMNAQKMITGRPLILLDNGKLYKKNFRKARIDINEFLTHCRNQGYFDLADIQTAVFEYNGAVSVLPAENARPLTPADMQLSPQQQKLIVNVILDGHVSEANLKMTGNNKVWLEKQLHSQGYHSEKEVFLGTVNTVDNTLTLYPLKTEEKSQDPFA
ncbi:MAG: DUF421 domain-containing protein [Ruminococcus sp.]|nr:DUF421 domain-containing protein [Ruminococcus sp.]